MKQSSFDSAMGHLGLCCLPAYLPGAGVHCRANGRFSAELNAQVMALTEGQCVELDVLASLLAAVRSARERAGTLGVEQRGEGPQP